TRWTVSMDIDLSIGHEMFSAVRETRDVSDHALETQRRTLNYGTGTGLVITVDHDSRKERSVSFPADDTSIPAELLATVLRALPDAPERRMRFHLITRDGTS